MKIIFQKEIIFKGKWKIGNCKRNIFFVKRNFVKIKYLLRKLNFIFIGNIIFKGTFQLQIFSKENISSKESLRN